MTIQQEIYRLRLALVKARKRRHVQKAQKIERKIMKLIEDAKAGRTG